MFVCFFDGSTTCHLNIGYIYKKLVCVENFASIYWPLLAYGCKRQSEYLSPCPSFFFFFFFFLGGSISQSWFSLTILFCYHSLPYNEWHRSSFNNICFLLCGGGQTCESGCLILFFIRVTSAFVSHRPGNVTPHYSTLRCFRKCLCFSAFFRRTQNCSRSLQL